MVRTLLLFVLLLIPLTISAQIGSPIPFGANQPSISWFELTTEHFRVIYHQGLEEEALEAAAVAEAIYPVVTGNLGQELSGRTPLVLSDLDDVSNAIALGDHYMFIWMRGIVADGNYGGIRSAGRAKWLRTVITHEFTHIVIDEAASFFNLNGFLPPGVPRWFNEGVARAMEPDGWTSDVDQVLRLAFDADDIEYDGDDALDGHLLYEGGQSLVRFMMEEYGARVIDDILHGGRDPFNGYNFGDAVLTATGREFSEIYEDWENRLKDQYEIALGRGDRIDNIAERIPLDDVRAVTWALPSPNGTEIAYAGRNDDRHFGFFVTDMKNGEDVDCLSIESGLEGVFTWDPDGRSLIVSKARYGSDRTLTHDLYRLGRGGGLDRITSDGNLSDPTYAPDRSAIIAVQTIEGRGNLVRVDPNSGTITPITTFTQDIQLYTPRYSPDGSTVAFSIFDVDGARAIGTIDLDLLRDSGRLDLRRLVRDSSNNRYPVWSPDGRSILYTSHFAGVPNLRRVDVASGAITQVTGVTDGLFATGWIPSSQSAIALAIEAPGDITPWRVSTKARSGERPVTPAERDPWQDITFDLTVPSVDAIKPATIIDEGSYESISGIAPILPIFPFLQNDIPTGNFEQFPYRIGAISQWWDPMQKHQILGYADYGLSSGTVGFDLFYVNNTLPISIATHVDQSLALQGVLPGNAATPDVLYYQKASGGDVTLALWLPALDALDIFHEIRLKLAATTRRAEGRDGDVARAQELFGTEHTVSTIGLGYTWTTPKFWFDAGYEKGLGLLEGDFEYDKLEAHISGQLPLIYPFRLIGTVHAVAQNGRQLPYDFVGLNRYNLLSTDVGLSLRTLTDYTIRIRGVNAWVFGNRAYTATGGLELGFDWIGPLRGSGLGLMVWAEQGSAWFSTDEDLAGFDPQEAFAWGVELRAPYLEKMHLALGLASARLDDVDFDLAFFTRVGWGF